MTNQQLTFFFFLSFMVILTLGNQRNFTPKPKEDDDWRRPPSKKKRKKIKLFLRFSSEVREAVAAATFFMIIQFIIWNLSDPTWTWRWRRRNQIQICFSPFFSHEIIKHWLPHPCLSVADVAVACVSLLFVLMSISFLQKYTT